MRYQHRWATALSLLLLSATSSLRTAAAEAEEDEEQPLPECGLYMAVSSSSTVEAPTWGLYAGRDIEKNTPISFGDVAIQTFHLFANAVEDEEEESALLSVVDFFEQYIWVPNGSGGQFEIDEGRIVTAVSGTGVLGGFNKQLTNADWNHETAFRRGMTELVDISEKGVSHPARGSMTSFFDVTMESTESIPAGMEIFCNYGENWQPSEEDDVELTKTDHEKIDQTIVKMIEFFEKHGAELDEKSKNDIFEFLIKDVMSAAAGSRKATKIASILPDSPDDLPEVMKDGGSLKLSSPAALRSLEWLSQHGRCMDNIRPGLSTIPHAGRGAFANRDMKEGGLVAPVPLVQIPDRAIMDMHELSKQMDGNNEEYFSRVSNQQTGSQLLYNYCLGHPESDMLFFPAGAGVALINHSEKPNAKLVWSRHPNHHQHWLDLEPEELIEEENQHLGLLMEVVATKDIKEGDEVTIDYGQEWSDAWKAHVEKWKNLEKSGDIPSVWPMRGLDLMADHKTKPFGASESYPDNIMMKCFLMVKKPDDEPPLNEKGEKIRLWSDLGNTIKSENLFDCDILVAEKDEVHGWLYQVRWTSDDAATIVKRVPHKAIVLMDKPNTSDQHFSHGFRHYVGIPDEIFPEGPWRDGLDSDSADDDDN